MTDTEQQGQAWRACRAFDARALDPGDHSELARLRADPVVEFVDQRDAQQAALGALLPPPDDALRAEPTRWVHYPWRRTVVGLLGPRAFRRLRLDRNRNLVTAAEQDRLAELRVGVVGLSVGHAIAHLLAVEGLCGELRLADFDDLELSNLNRVSATVFDLGVNKAVVAARRIAEVDPYLPVRVWEGGMTTEALDGFLDGLDVVVEECDALEMKLELRAAARARRIPVLMATSDRGLFDVERFDAEPHRPVLHGLLDGLDMRAVAGMSTREKVPYVLRVLDAANLSARGAACLVDVGRDLTTWPQMAGDVSVGASAVGEAVRRIGLGEPLRSGRGRFDVAAMLDRLETPTPPAKIEEAEAFVEHVPDGADIAQLVASAATRAPSGGNVQPWRVDVAPACVTLRLAPEHTTAMDVGLRASAVAIGAATFNARVAAAAHGMQAEVDFGEADCGEADCRESACEPLVATVRLSSGNGVRSTLAGLYRPMLDRETCRHHGTPRAIDAATAAELADAARHEGATLTLVDGPALAEAADLLAAADRIRYLTPRLHAEMFAEVRWPGRDPLDSGIDVRSLELSTADLARLEVLRRPDVMAWLARWDTGRGLGDDTRDRVGAGGALAVLTVAGATLTDYARGGAATEAVWTIAGSRGFAVQPVSPAFLYPGSDAEFRALSADHAAELRDLRRRFVTLCGSGDDSLVLVLRLCEAPPASVRSQRRGDTGRAGETDRNGGTSGAAKP